MSNLSAKAYYLFYEHFCIFFIFIFYYFFFLPTQGDFSESSLSQVSLKSPGIKKDKHSGNKMHFYYKFKIIPVY